MRDEPFPLKETIAESQTRRTFRLGAGRSAVADLGITTMADALRLEVTDVTVLPDAGDGQTDVRITLHPTLTLREEAH